MVALLPFHSQFDHGWPWSALCHLTFMVDHGQTMVGPWTNHGLPWLPSMNNHVQNMVDHGQTVVLLPGQLWNWRLKKFQDWTGFKPMTSAIPVQYSTHWAIRPSRSPATLRVRKLLYNTPRGWRKEVNIWNFIHLDCREWYEDVIDHPSYANNSSSCEIKVLKKWPTPRCRSFIKIFSRGATGFHWQEKPFWNWASLQENFPLDGQAGKIIITAVGQFACCPTHNETPADGLIAQLVEHCTGITEVMGLNPVQAWVFSGFNFTTAHCVQNCNDQSYLHICMNVAIFNTCSRKAIPVETTFKTVTGARK